MLHDPRFWLAISFCIFLGLMIKYVWPIIIRMIDGKTKSIADEIDSALEIKNKAQALMLEAEKYQQETLNYAHKLIEDARAEANSIINSAKHVAEQEVAKKLAVAMQRINQEEEKIIREVKSRIINNAIKTIADKLPANSKKSSDFVIETAISDLNKIIN